MLSENVTMTSPPRLISLIRQETSRETPSSLRPLIEAILARYGDAAQAMLYYGSCFRKGDDSNGIVDLYLVVDSYRHAYRRGSYALLNTLLPPNVFYLEVPYDGGVRRAKYAVFSCQDLQRGAAMRRFHSYLWARLAQPMALVYARNDQVAEQVYSAMAQALLTFLTRVLPRIPSQFTSRELWSEGLRLSYAAELRAERRDKLVALFDDAPHYYEELTRAALTMVPYSVEPLASTPETCYRSRIPTVSRTCSSITWAMRRLLGKALSILLLLKASYTFRGGVGYLLWKIERHSGVTVEIDQRLRRIPLVGVAVLFWRLYRRGAFR